MTYAAITTLTLATSSSAPIWIAGWIIVLALLIGAPIYYMRKRRNRTRRGHRERT
jgi:hypothetical protein